MTTPNPLGSQLVDRDAAGLDPHTLATVALLRQRRRMRLLAGITVGLWLLAALVIPAFLMPMHTSIRTRQAAVVRQATVDANNPSAVNELMALNRESAFAYSASTAVSTACSLLAALATVWLVMTVRRSTLDQVNLALAGLSDQLRRLEASGKPPVRPEGT